MLLLLHWVMCAHSTGRVQQTSRTGILHEMLLNDAAMALYSKDQQNNNFSVSR